MDLDVEQYRAVPGTRMELRATATTPGPTIDKKSTRTETTRLFAELDDLQTRLFAEGSRRVLVVLQAIDTGGKDGTIRRVFGNLNPQGLRVASFKAPSPVELAHDYLWRVHSHVPADGEIAIFNRSHYEDVLIVRVHELVPRDQWRRRYRHIRDFERMLADEGTSIVKFFLHISPEEQRSRLQDRIDEPESRWKFNADDLRERTRWSDYEAAFEDMLSETSTGWAPWYVVPADRRWYRDYVVTRVMVDLLESLHPVYPPAPDGIEGLVVE